MARSRSGSDKYYQLGPLASKIDSQLRVYIGDIDGVKVFSSEGQYLATIDTPGYPYGLTISDDDKLFVSIGTAVVQYELPTPE